MIQSIKSLVSRPYPSDRTPEYYPLVGFIVFLVLALLHPFGLIRIPLLTRLFVEFGYGLMTTMVLFLHYFLLDRFLNSGNSLWTIGREIISILFIVIVISIANTLYTWALGYIRISVLSFLAFIGITAVVAVFPVTIVVLLTHNRHLRQHLKDAAVLNSSLVRHEHRVQPETDRMFVFEAHSPQDRVRIRADDICFIQSQRNYLMLYYQNQNKLERPMLRGTLTQAEKACGRFEFLQRCHRSYIVNLNRIASIEGNSLGYTLTITDCHETVPVSRAYTRWFKRRVLARS